MPVHVLTFRDIRRVYGLDQEERSAIIAVIQSTPETLVEATARLNAIRTIRSELPTLPNRDATNAIPGTVFTLSPSEVETAPDAAFAADYSGL